MPSFILLDSGQRGLPVPMLSLFVVKNLVFSKAYVHGIDGGVRQLEPNRGMIVA